jgi:sulfide:quinone oxidoreductase
MSKRIVVVGGGTGGTLAANLLARRLRKQVHTRRIQIDVFGDRAEHVFQPDFLEIAFHGRHPSQASRRESDLVGPGIRFHPKPIVHINLQERTVVTRDSDRFAYDYLVIATGARTRPELVPGLAESALNFHTDGEQAAAIWRALQAFHGGRIVVAIAGLPYKCPPAPNEASFLLDAYLRKRGIREKTQLTFATPYPRAYSAAEISRVVEPLYEERDIDVVPFFNVDSVDPARRQIYSLEGDALDFDLLLAVPPHAGAEVIRASGIGDKEGWVPTDRYQLNILGRDDAYALGDATNIPIAKTGVVAHLEAKVAVDNIVADLLGEPRQSHFNGRINCPFDTGDGRATFVVATYETPPKPRPPTRLNFWMKRGFAHLYWATLSGRWEPLFEIYFGRTATKVPRVPVRLRPEVSPVPGEVGPRLG